MLAWEGESRLTRDVICELSNLLGFSWVNRGWLNVEWTSDDELEQFSLNPVWHLETLLWHRRTNLLSLIHFKMPEAFRVQYDHLYSWTFRYILTSASRLTQTDVCYWSVKQSTLYDYLETIEITFTCSTLDNCIHNFNKLATKTEIT